MEQNQLPAIFVPQPLPATTAELTPVQKGWLVMADKREVLFSSLTRGELEIQNLKNSLTETSTLEEVQSVLKQVKDIAALKKDERIQFTSLLEEKLKKPAMAFEGRNDALIAQVVSTEFTLRKKASDALQATQNLASEKQRFIAHLKNQNTLIRAEYVINLQSRVSFHYQNALADKKKNKKDLGAYITMIKNDLAAIEVGKPEKFNLILVEREEAKTIHASIEKYNPAEDLAKAVESVDEKFAMYDEDFKNAVAALESEKTTLKLNTSRIEEATVISTSTNNLVASADTIVYGNVPKIKKRLVIVEENTEPWAISVLTAFIKNWNDAKGKLQVKTWSKLTLAQMAAALSKMATENNDLKFEGLTLKEEEK